MKGQTLGLWFPLGDKSTSFLFPALSGREEERETEGASPHELISLLYPQVKLVCSLLVPDNVLFVPIRNVSYRIFSFCNFRS